MMREERRASLIAQCAQQRSDAAADVHALLAPARAGGATLTLTIAGVVLGLVVSRAGRALPLLTAGMRLWKLVRHLLPMPRV